MYSQRITCIHSGRYEHSQQTSCVFAASITRIRSEHGKYLNRTSHICVRSAHCVYLKQLSTQLSYLLTTVLLSASIGTTYAPSRPFHSAQVEKFEVH